MERLRWPRAPRRLITLILLAVLPGGAQAPFPDQVLAPSAADAGIGVHMDIAGSYTMTTRRPARTFGGNAGHPLSLLTMATGACRPGRYQEVRFTYRRNVARADSIRVSISRPVVLFRTTYLAAGSKSEPFPLFTTVPRALFHISYHGSFGVYGFQLSGSEIPWLFFDPRANGFLLSPAANFLVAALTMHRDGSLSCGISQTIRILPEHFSQSTILAIGESINGVSTSWAPGQLGASPTSPWAGGLLDRPRGARLLPFSRQLMVRGHGAGYQTRLCAAGDRAGVYATGELVVHERHAAPTLFPTCLATLQRQPGLPRMVQASWIDASSPYRARYRMSGNVSIDPRYWSMVMSYLRQSGVTAYEQDWLSTMAQTAFNLVDPGAFLQDMAAAGLTLQYCMPDPHDYLQGALYN